MTLQQTEGPNTAWTAQILLGWFGTLCSEKSRNPSPHSLLVHEAPSSFVVTGAGDTGLKQRRPLSDRVPVGCYQHSTSTAVAERCSRRDSSRERHHNTPASFLLGNETMSTPSAKMDDSPAKQSFDNDGRHHPAQKNNNSRRAAATAGGGSLFKDQARGGGQQQEQQQQTAQQQLGIRRPDAAADTFVIDKDIGHGPRYKDQIRQQHPKNLPDDSNEDEDLSVPAQQQQLQEPAHHLPGEPSAFLAEAELVHQIELVEAKEVVPGRRRLYVVAVGIIVVIAATIVGAVCGVTGSCRSAKFSSTSSSSSEPLPACNVSVVVDCRVLSKGDNNTACEDIQPPETASCIGSLAGILEFRYDNEKQCNTSSHHQGSDADCIDHDELGIESVQVSCYPYTPYGKNCTCCRVKRVDELFVSPAVVSAGGLITVSSRNGFLPQQIECFACKLAATERVSSRFSIPLKYAIPGGIR
jgi:hypothetical protein